MDEPTHEILIAADRLGEWEFPADDNVDLWPVIDSIVAELESITGYHLDVDRHVQDASFMTDIGLLDDRYYNRAAGTGSLYYIFSFRFSHFGRLFTLHGGEWKQQYEKLGLGRCIEAIRSRGFVYVAADAIESPYDGINGSNNPISGSPLTWWIRYFDYI